MFRSMRSCLIHVILGVMTSRRYNKIKPGSVHVERNEEVLEIRKTRGGALLDVEDHIKAVLDDNDFVSVGRSTSSM